MENFYFTMRVLATIALIGPRLYFGPVGWGAGICDGIIIYAIWFNRERTTKGL